jgi:hypothetical protein
MLYTHDIRERPRVAIDPFDVVQHDSDARAPCRRLLS